MECEVKNKRRGRGSSGGGGGWGGGNEESRNSHGGMEGERRRLKPTSVSLKCLIQQKE